MWILLILMLVAIFLLHRQKTRDCYKPSDEKLTQQISDTVYPKLLPVNTVSRDGNTARMMFIDTDTYAGRLADATADPSSVTFTFSDTNKIPFKL